MRWNGVAYSDERIGAALKALRKEEGITQQEVATTLNIPRSAVSLFESGQRQVSVPEFITLLWLYRIGYNEFIRRL